MQVTFKDLDDLGELIARVERWKRQVKELLEDLTVPEQIKKRLKFKNYLNEAKLLKLASIPDVERL